MTAAFLITLREGLEAALIVGIIAAYLVKSGRRDALPRVWLGVTAAVAVSIATGILVVATIGRLPLVVQETLEGLAALAAVAVLTWMVFWMRRQGRGIRGELHGRIDSVLATGSTVALVGLAFVAVIREGLETVLFLLAVLASSASESGNATGAFIGGVAGLGVACLTGWAFFRGALRLDLRRFFNITGVLVIFVAAGLMAFAVAELAEAGWFANSGAVFDLSGVLPETGALGSILAGLLGYRSAPTPLEVVAYLAYLIPVLALFLFGDRRPARGTVPA